MAKEGKSGFRGLAAASLVVAGGCLVVFMMARRTAPEGVRPSATRDVFDRPAIPDARPAPRPVAAPPEKDAAPPAETNRAVRLENGVEVVKSLLTTNSNGAVIEKLYLANGKTMSKIHPRKPIFENVADQLIAMAVAVEPGASMPPLPDLSNVDEEFAHALLTPIRIEENDSAEVRELKARVLEARAYLADEVKKGGTVREALRAYQAEMERHADSHAMAVQQIVEIRRSDGIEAAREFCARVNEAFRARGIPELDVYSTEEHEAKEPEDDTK
jgi:hypothetical protein